MLGYVFDISRNQISSISYEAARIVVIKSGKMVGVKLRKVILRHENLSTTQRYLGTISDIEAIRWIENIYG